MNSSPKKRRMCLRISAVFFCKKIKTPGSSRENSGAPSLSSKGDPKERKLLSALRIFFEERGPLLIFLLGLLFAHEEEGKYGCQNDQPDYAGQYDDHGGN